MKNKERKCWTPLTLRDRIDIEHIYGASITDIAQYINRNKSTVLREVKGKARM